MVNRPAHAESKGQKQTASSTAQLIVASPLPIQITMHVADSQLVESVQLQPRTAPPSSTTRAPKLSASCKACMPSRAAGATRLSSPISSPPSIQSTASRLVNVLAVQRAEIAALATSSSTAIPTASQSAIYLPTPLSNPHSTSPRHNLHATQLLTPQSNSPCTQLQSLYRARTHTHTHTHDARTYARQQGGSFSLARFSWVGT